MDSTKKCLNVAEKIIQALNDSEIIEKYFLIKDKLLASYEPQMNIQNLKEKNTVLRRQYEDLLSNVNSPSEITIYVTNYIQEITNDIIPNSSSNKNNFTSACQDLIDAYQTILEGHQFLKKNLVEKQRLLQNHMLNLKSIHTNEMANIRQKRAILCEEWKQRCLKINQKIDNFKLKSQQFQTILSTLENEKENLQELCKNDESKPLILKNHLKELDRKGADAELKHNKLMNEKTFLEFQLKQIQNQHTELNKLNDKIQIISEPKITLNQLRIEIEKLEIEHLQLSKRLNLVHF